MSCLPETGGCERFKTDPFVNYLNAEEETSYQYEQCLDRSDRNNSQPETLYRDRNNAQTLVIERKTVVWPIDCVERHKIEHDVSELIQSKLNGKFLDDYYQLQLPSIGPLKPKKRERELFATKIVEEVLRKAQPAQPVCRDSSLMGYGFTRLDPSEVEPDQGRGITICWSGPPIEHIDPNNLPEKLDKQISCIFDACRKKFQPYMNARRILIVEPQGNLCFIGPEWWSVVFHAKMPPIQISEV